MRFVGIKLMKRRLFLFVVAVMLMIPTACGSNENHEESAVQAKYGVPEEEAEPAAHENAGEAAASETYKYETDLIRYGELSGTFSFRKDVERTQTDYAVYYFEPSISEQERQACIEATDSVLSCIDGALPELEIAVFTDETFDGIAVSGNRLYTSIQPWDSLEYLVGVLLAGYSEWGNFGLAYGYANRLCIEAGLDHRESDGFMPMSNTELYDLNLLCFDEKFVSPDDVEAAKNNACLFVDEYLSAHSDTELLELLSDSGTAEGVRRANEALEAFYIENDVDCSLTAIRYQHGGVTLDYAVACEYAVFYIETDWQDGTWETNPRVSDNFLHEDYGEIRAFFECNVRQMRQYQELFGFESYDNDLTVVFSNSARISAVFDSYYTGEDHTARVSSVTSLMHEYIHSVMEWRYDWSVKWKCEGFARYYEVRYNEYAYDFWDYDYNNPSENERGMQVKKYIDWLGRPISSKTDSQEFADVMVYACGQKDPNLTYTTGESFVGYLVDQYGEPAVIAYVCSGNEYNEQWGKSYEELVQDWNAYINENYSWYRTEITP